MIELVFLRQRHAEEGPPADRGRPFLHAMPSDQRTSCAAMSWAMAMPLQAMAIMAEPAAAETMGAVRRKNTALGDISTSLVNPGSIAELNRSSNPPLPRLLEFARSTQIDVEKI